MAVIGGCLSDLLIPRKTDGNFGNVLMKTVVTLMLKNLQDRNQQVVVVVKL